MCEERVCDEREVKHEDERVEGVVREAGHHASIISTYGVECVAGRINGQHYHSVYCCIQ